METKSIGVMGALEEEVQFISRNAPLSRAEQHLKRTLYHCDFTDYRAIVVSSGIGKVRAATYCQFLIDYFGVGQVIFVGIAGALRPELRIGDIVVSDRAVEWDFQSATVERRWYQADTTLIALALKAAERLGLRARVGSVLTGDQPVIGLSHKHELWQRFNGDCVEMEGAAVAQVCSLNEVPFVIVRVISDFANESTHQQLVHSFAKVSSIPGQVAMEMLKQVH